MYCHTVRPGKYKKYFGQLSESIPFVIYAYFESMMVSQEESDVTTINIRSQYKCTEV